MAAIKALSTEGATTNTREQEMEAAGGMKEELENQERETRKSALKLGTPTFVGAVLHNRGRGGVLVQCAYPLPQDVFGRATHPLYTDLD